MTIHLKASVENLKALRDMGYELTTTATEYIRYTVNMHLVCIQLYLSGKVGIRIISELHPGVTRTMITIEQAAEIHTLLSLGMSTESAYALFS